MKSFKVALISLAVLAFLPTSAFAQCRVRVDGVNVGCFFNAPVFTGAVSFNGSIGTTGSVLIGGTPASWSTGPTLSGTLTAAAVVSNGNVAAGSGNFFFFQSRSQFNSPADGLINFSTNTSGSVGPQINIGTAAPTINSCSTGTITSHSSNMGGEVTATGATTCSINFGLPNFTNQPFCTATDETTAAALRISAISVSGMTVTGLTSGDKWMYHCIGGI